MNRGKLMRIILAVIAALILVGVVLMAWSWWTRNNRQVIRIDLDDRIEPVAFENLCLIPGDSCTYTIRLTGDAAKKYDLHLSFEETQEKNLKNFACIRIESNGQVLCDELMATVFAGEGIDLSVALNRGQQQDLIITYYMPIEVGNEAQNAEAFFDLLVFNNAFEQQATSEASL